MRAMTWALAIIVALLVAWWVTNSIEPTEQEEIAVWKERAAVAEAEVAALKPQLDSARSEAATVDTVIRTVLARPQPTRPLTFETEVLDTLQRDTLTAILRRFEAYSDTLERENLILRTTLDTAQQTFQRYRDAAEATIAGQDRQIRALHVITDIQECRIAGVLRCPSRKVSFGLGVLAVVATGAYLRSR